jgi:PAS domain S-box-containing protein
MVSQRVNEPSPDNSDSDAQRKLDELRERAEQRVELSPEALEKMSPDDVLSVVHELQVHEIELQMQNEELQRAQMALQVARAEYADLYQRAPIGYVTLDAKRRISRVNEAALGLLGVRSRSPLGSDIRSYLHRDDAVEFARFWQRLDASGGPETCEVRFRNSEEGEFWAQLEAVMAPERDADENHESVRITISDITNRKRADQMVRELNDELERRVQERTAQLQEVNQELRSEVEARVRAEQALRRREQELEYRVGERTRELSTILNVSQNMSSTLEIDVLMGMLLDELRRLVDYTGCAIYLVENDDLCVLDYRGPLPRESMLQIRLPLDNAVGPSDVLARREPVIIGDLLDDSLMARLWREKATSQQRAMAGESRSWMGVPLVVKDNVIGVLRLDHKQPHYFAPDHVEVVVGIANHAATAIENARLYQQATQLAAMEERQRLARELHDSVAQTFYGIALAAHGALAMLKGDRAGTMETIEYILSLANTGLTEVRALIFDLRPEALRREGLVVALSKQTDALRSRNDMVVDDALGSEPDASVEVKEVIYRIVQEALRNVVRHSSARRVSVRLWEQDGLVKLEVQDNGVGFDPARVASTSMGLRSMRDRAASLGGRVRVESTAGQGTRVYGEIPAFPG